MASEMDNNSNLNNKRYKLILQIQEFIKDECSYREIARRLGISRNTVSKFKEGDPQLLYQYGIKQSKLDGYRNHIVQCLDNGYSKSKTVKSIYELGYTGGLTNAFGYLKKVENETRKTFEPQKYQRTMTEALKYRTGSKGKENDFITRNGVFRFLWMNGELTEEHREYIFNQYPVLYRFQNCIRDFRQIFDLKNVQWLYLFIQKYSECEIKEIQSFAKGLCRDIDALENAVTYDLSNGFVEGTNSKLKMVKRTMFGRCNIPLLKAKMMLMKPNIYG